MFFVLLLTALVWFTSPTTATLYAVDSEQIMRCLLQLVLLIETKLDRLKIIPSAVAAEVAAESGLVGLA